MKRLLWWSVAVALWMLITRYVQSQEIIGGSIVYAIDTEHGSAIALLDVETGINMQLTGGLYSDGQPELSPDGDHIAFISNREGNFDIYVINIDGTGLQQLTDSPKAELFPTWSPDSTHIAYVQSQGRGSNLEGKIFIVNADGTDIQQLNTGDGGGNSPDWSPDGSRIAFMSWRGGVDNHVFTVNIDGTDLRQLTFGDDHGLYPLWSPDGSKIAFHGRNGHIYYMSADGKGTVRQITTAPDVELQGWAGDSAILYLRAGLGGYDEIFYICLDGTELSNLDIQLPLGGFSFNLASLEVTSETTPVSTSLPSNGRLLFTMAQEGVSQLFIMNADGTDLAQITSSSEGAFSPSWSPDGTQIAFSNRNGLMVMQANGRDSYAVPNGQFLGDSHWSPTRNELIAVGAYDLTMVDLTTNTTSVLSIDGFTPGAFNQNPAWSPTGDALVFASTGSNPIQSALDGDPQMDIYIIGRDGAHVRKLGNTDTSHHGGLNWTSTNQVIFSASKIIDGRLIDRIFSYDLLAETITLLSNPAEDTASPAVSPDETKIAFVQGLHTIMIMNIDGTHPTAVVTLDEIVLDLDWQPVNIR